ncbi:MAG: hypothetical protein H6927_09245 [Burkholderiaceae bacterium]|nr:hypothetical protein [Pseudomonadota bacterium]MBS0598196.1 hypothetical protein [Pseudomonadota bacterium]MCO5115368.1 hypothetical protein [Burkholderiaceae bacterium]MCP5218281.1 hypothetical protein [Burkholderiaceae bacterium]
MSDEEIEDAFKLWLHWDFAVADLAKGKPDAFCELLRSKEQISALVRPFLADLIDGTLPPPPSST